MTNSIHHRYSPGSTWILFLEISESMNFGYLQVVRNFSPTVLVFVLFSYPHFLASRSEPQLVRFGQPDSRVPSEDGCAASSVALKRISFTCLSPFHSSCEQLKRQPENSRASWRKVKCGFTDSSRNRFQPSHKALSRVFAYGVLKRLVVLSVMHAAPQRWEERRL